MLRRFIGAVLPSMLAFAFQDLHDCGWLFYWEKHRRHWTCRREYCLSAGCPGPGCGNGYRHGRRCLDIPLPWKRRPGEGGRVPGKYSYHPVFGRAFAYGCPVCIMRPGPQTVRGRGQRVRRSYGIYPYSDWRFPASALCNRLCTPDSKL